MIRRILCEKCGERKPLHPEDAAAGWKHRYRYLRVAKPAVHEIIIHTAYEPQKITVASIMCDQCGDDIPDGTPAVAYTMWRGDEEPGNWEEEFVQRQ